MCIKVQFNGFGVLAVLQTESTARFMYIRHGLLSAFRVARHSSFVIPKMSYKPNVVFVLGGPGAGKGTQCDLLTQVFVFLLC